MRKFARDLLQLCRSSEEIKAMLAEEEEEVEQKEGCCTKGRVASYPRIQLALSHEQKEVLTLGVICKLIVEKST